MSISSFTMVMSISSIAAAMINPYSRFDDLISQFGEYDWTDHIVTTSDGYILTTFQIHANPNVEYKGSILVQHSDQQDGVSWIEEQDGKSFQLLLADEGYDVWIGNNRGTEYSQRHTQYDAAGETAREYWDFSWTDMQNDDKANIEEILRITDDEKIYYLGYSQGSIQMHYALAQDSDWFKERLHRAVMLAPCFYRVFVPALVLEWEYNNSIATFRENGIYAIGGPNWTEDLKKICEIYDYVVCRMYGGKPWQPRSVKAVQHWWQNGLLLEFNEFQENWSSNDRTSAPIDVSKIRDVPMSFFVSSLDFTCHETVAYEYIEKMSTETNIIRAGHTNHWYWSNEANSDWFMTRLLDQLAITY